MSFGKRLRKLRKNRGLTLTQMADKFHKTKATFSAYENNKRKPSIDLVAELADFFNVSIDYLMGKTDMKEDKTDDIRKAIEDNPELAEYWDHVLKREQLQLMFDQAKDLPDEAIKDVIKIMMRIDKEEGNY